MAKTDNVYVAMHNPMIHESVFGIISIHKTRKGAEMAMEFHKAEEKKRYDEFMAGREGRGYSSFGTFEAWGIFEYEIQD